MSEVADRHVIWELCPDDGQKLELVCMDGSRTTWVLNGEEIGSDYARRVLDYAVRLSDSMPEIPS